MKTKNIFKALALAILMPALLLNTSCNSDITNIEDTDAKGYTLPVTVNVTRQGDDPATKATYNESTRKLEFSTGDQLFVFGSHSTAGIFQGTLTWQSGGTFSGTLTTENSYDGTAQALLESAEFASARLLPADYDEYDYFYFDPVTGFLETSYTKAFATSKATAVAQFSLEEAKAYSSGFALEPSNAILNFTISGLTPGSHNVEVYGISGAVTANGSGVATFAVGVDGDTYSENINLFVDTDYFDLDLFGGIDTPLEAGKIYNITRSTLTYPIALSAVTSSYVGSVVTTDGNVYATVAAASAASKTAAAMIAYVSGTGHGLALALEDEGWVNWSTAKTTCEAHTPAVTGGSWQLPSQEEWNNMITAAGSYTALRDGFSSFGGTNMNAGTYWSSTDAGTMGSIQLKYGYKFHESEGSWGTFGSTSSQNTRACLAF